MQFGCKLFTTDEAILTEDWVTNLALIAAYDMRQGQYVWFNKSYKANRRVYQKMMKEQEKIPVREHLLNSRLMKIQQVAMERFQVARVRIESGTIREIAEQPE